MDLDRENFYEKYIIKKVKLVRNFFHEAKAYQLTDNIYEFKFFKSTLNNWLRWNFIHQATSLVEE